jgi:DNA-directed RNA polymerase specialized sigma24 family protein
VKAIPGTLREGGTPFRTTHWTVVLLAAQDQSPAAGRTALASFCQDYWPPIYTFLRRRGHTPSDAQDLVQGFFAHLLEENTLSRANREKGRLRTFLLGALDYFLADDRARAQALKRGGGQRIVSMDDPGVEARAAQMAGRPDAVAVSYDRLWASTIVDRAWLQLGETLAAEGKTRWFQEMKPLLVGGAAAPPSQEDVAATLDMSVENLRTSLHRLRRRYRETLRTEVARTVSTSREIDEEMEYIYHLLKG